MRHRLIPSCPYNSNVLVEIAKKIATVVEKQAEIDPERLADAIQIAILKAWDRQVRNFLVEMYEKVKLWRTEKPSYWEYQQVLQMLKDYFGGEGLVSLIRRPVIQLALFGYRKGKSETLEEVKGPGVDISLNQTDRYALRVLEKYTTFWLKKREDEFVDKVMAEELRKYYELGLTWDELAQNLESRLKDKWRRNRKAYFKTVARHWANLTRQLARVSAYEEAGVKYAKVVAVLDKHTTLICRTMHGRIIPVSAMVRQRDKILRVMQNGGGVKALQQVHRLWTEKEFEAYLKRKRNLSTDSLVKDGVVMPPYHFNCRTRTVAWQQNFKELDPVKRGVLNKAVGQAKQKRGDFFTALRQYTNEEIAAAVDDVLRKARQGKVEFVDNQELLKHFGKHGHPNELNLPSPRDYLREANATIIRAWERGNVHIVEGRGRFPSLDMAFLDDRGYVVFTSLLSADQPKFPYIRTFFKLSSRPGRRRRKWKNRVKDKHVPIFTRIVPFTKADSHKITVWESILRTISVMRRWMIT